MAMGQGRRLFVQGDDSKLNRGAKDKPLPNTHFLSDTIRKTKRWGGSKRRPLGWPGLPATTSTYVCPVLGILVNSILEHTFRHSENDLAWELMWNNVNRKINIDYSVSFRRLLLINESIRARLVTQQTYEKKSTQYSQLPKEISTLPISLHQKPNIMLKDRSFICPKYTRKHCPRCLDTSIVQNTWSLIVPKIKYLAPVRNQRQYRNV